MRTTRRTTRSARGLGTFLLAIVALAMGLPAMAQTVTYEYDNLQRVSSATYSDGTVIQYQYDAAGNRTVYAVTRPTAPGTLQLSAATYSVGEAGPTIAIAVTRTGGSFGAASVNYATSDGTATAGSDYTAASGTLSWVDGDSTGKSFSTSIADDAVFEGSETITVTLSGANGASLGTPASATITIIDNDSPPPGTLQLSPASYTVSENVVSVTVTVSRANGSAGTASVNYATGNGTATAGSDYTAASGTLNWAVGDAADKTFNVQVTDDTAVESSETINLTLSSASGATLGTPSSGTITITDNDSATIPNVPAAIYPAYQFLTTSCPPGETCTGFSGGVGGATAVTWDPPVGGPAVHHYELQQAFNSANFTANLSIVFSGPQQSWVPQSFIGANPSNWYYYRVRACNEANQCSAWREVSVWEVCGGASCNPSQ